MYTRARRLGFQLHSLLFKYLQNRRPIYCFPRIPLHSFRIHYDTISRLKEIIQSQAGKLACAFPYIGPDGNIVYFDVQKAEPGAFTVPGVVDLETYRVSEYVEFQWIYFKGDPTAGPKPGHPFDMPFDNSNTNFTLGLVNGSKTSKVVQEIMRKFCR